jgi:hypothetical protein
MEHREARELLATEIAKYRDKPYAELAAMIDDSDHPAFALVGPSGSEYWVDIEAFWDGFDSSSNVVRLRGAICGGGIDYQVPVCNDFLKAEDGTFVDE